MEPGKDERAFVAEAMATMKAGQNVRYANQAASSKEPAAPDPSAEHHNRSLVEAAKLMNVTTAAVDRARADALAAFTGLSDYPVGQALEALRGGLPHGQRPSGSATAFRLEVGGPGA